MCVSWSHLTCRASRRARACLLRVQKRKLVLWVQASICSELLRRLAKHRPALVRAMAAVGEVDCVIALATPARERNWCRPVLTADNVLHISQGPGLVGCLTWALTSWTLDIKLSCDTGLDTGVL